MFSTDAYGRLSVPLELIDLQAFPASGSGKKQKLQLQDLWRALKRRRRLVTVVAAAVLTLSLANAVRQRLFAPVYQGSFQLLITDPISSGDGRGRQSDDGGVVESLARNRVSTDLPSLIQLLRSPSVLAPVAEGFRTSPGDLAGRLLIETVRVGRNESVNGVLAVSLRGGNPAQVQQQLDVLSRTYLQEALSHRRLRLTEGLRFLDEQEPQLQRRVDLAQQQLADFRVRHALLEPEVEGTALKGEAQALQQEQRQLQTERARLLSLRQGVAIGQLNAGNFSVGAGSGSSDGVTVTQADADLLDQLRDVEQKLTQARSVYRADSPRVRDLEVFRTQLSRQLRSTQLEAIDTALALNRTRQQAIAGQRQEVQAQFLEKPELIKQYQELQQRLELASENLASFLTTRETFKLELAQDTVPWRVIAPPQVGSVPVEPNLQEALLKGLLLALGSGVAVGLLRDRFDHVFHHPAEVREELQQPLLGHIPHVPMFRGVRDEQTFLLGKLDATSTGLDEEERYHRFFYQEAFRNLFTSLRFVNADKPVRSLALTSSLPSEGKSLVNVLLAKTLAEMGQKVLLVDADLRKPQLHHRLGINNLVGLTNLLANDGLPWQEAIQPVKGHDTWWALTAGPRAPDPARLFSSPRAAQVVRQIAEQGDFDLVLYDTPPALGLADAALLAEHLDGLMLLISLDRVDRNLPREAIDRILSAGAPLLGVVTNAVTQEEEAFSSAGGYRYGGYRYGYGRYGYGGYGYAPYDVRNAYAYYQGSGDADQPAALPEAEPAAIGPRQLPRRDWWRPLWRWLDR